MLKERAQFQKRVKPVQMDVTGPIIPWSVSPMMEKPLSRSLEKEANSKDSTSDQKKDQGGKTDSKKNQGQRKRQGKPGGEDFESSNATTDSPPVPENANVSSEKAYLGNIPPDNVARHLRLVPVWVRAPGKKPVFTTAALDSGCSRTLIDEDFAKKIGLSM